MKKLIKNRREKLATKEMGGRTNSKSREMKIK
jgi:hypothetical protein